MTRFKGYHFGLEYVFKSFAPPSIVIRKPFPFPPNKNSCPIHCIGRARKRERETHTERNPHRERESWRERERQARVLRGQSMGGVNSG